MTSMDQTPANPLERVLLVANRGVAADVVEAALTARGYDVARASPDAELFSCALGRAVIVYLPAANLLSAHLDSQSGGEHAGEVLAAARAPGVKLLVLALPCGSAHDGIVESVERSGKPFVVLRGTGLLEEVAEALRQGEGTLWLPRTGEVRVSHGSALAEAIALALESEEQGRVKELPAETFDLAGLFAAACGMAGGRIRVRPMAPLIYRAMRPFLRGLQRGEPQLRELADQLLSAARRERSLQAAPS